MNRKDLETFLNAARRERAAVHANEPGCLRFDIVLFDEKDGTGAFIETYSDQAAADKHRQFPHFDEFFDAIKDINVNWTARLGMVVD